MDQHMSKTYYHSGSRTLTVEPLFVYQVDIDKLQSGRCEMIGTHKFRSRAFYKESDHKIYGGNKCHIYKDIQLIGAPIEWLLKNNYTPCV